MSFPLSGRSQPAAHPLTRLRSGETRGETRRREAQMFGASRWRRVKTMCFPARTHVSVWLAGPRCRCSGLTPSYPARCCKLAGASTRRNRNPKRSGDGSRHRDGNLDRGSHHGRDTCTSIRLVDGDLHQGAAPPRCPIRDIIKSGPIDCLVPRNSVRRLT